MIDRLAHSRVSTHPSPTTRGAGHAALSTAQEAPDEDSSMRIARSKALLLVLPLALVTPQARADEDRYYCDETATNDPPMSCWLVGSYKGMCSNHAATLTWTCGVATGWIPVPPDGIPGGPGPGDGNHLNGHGLAIPAIASGDMPALAAGDRGRDALLTIRTDALDSDTPVTALSLLQPGPTASAIELRLQRTPAAAGKLVVVREDAAAESSVVLATLPLADGIDHVHVDWAIDPIDGPVLAIATRDARLKLPLPALDSLTRLEVMPSTTTAIVLDVDQHRRDAGSSDR
jgi:hypothetical protein